VSRFIVKRTGIFALLLVTSLGLLQACSTANDPDDGGTIVGPTPPPPPPPPPPTTGQLAFATTASRGWQSIAISVDGRSIGTLTQFVNASTSANCTPLPNARVVTTLPPGSYRYVARADTGGTWENTVTVTAGACNERILTCTDGNCATAAPPRVLQPLGDWGTFTTGASSNGDPVLRIGVRDHQCEDGDILRVAINGVTVIERELVNREYTQDFRFRRGANTITVTAVNGSGNKGPCDYSNNNTGEISVAALNAQGQITTSRKQVWQLEAGAGSSSNIVVNLQ
jgi:hypothetical protein